MPATSLTTVDPNVVYTPPLLRRDGETPILPVLYPPVLPIKPPAPSGEGPSVTPMLPPSAQVTGAVATGVTKTENGVTKYEVKRTFADGHTDMKFATKDELLEDDIALPTKTKKAFPIVPVLIGAGALGALWYFTRKR
jgi:hypothetical protein